MTTAQSLVKTTWKISRKLPFLDFKTLSEWFCNNYIFNINNISSYIKTLFTRVSKIFHALLTISKYEQTLSIEIYKIINNTDPPVMNILFLCENVHNIQNFQILSNITNKIERHGLEIYWQIIGKSTVKLQI